MQFSVFCFLLALPVIALACEGECITGTTNEFVRRMTPVFERALKASEARFVSYTGLPSSKDLDYFEPFFTAFKDDAPKTYEKDIFPGFFHGKCQRHGVEPEGCPNPDCPVVCGTPGSMCHFYPKLRSIVYNSTRNIAESFSDTSSEPHQQVLQRVEAASPPRSRARSFRFARSSFYPASSERSISTAGFLKQHSRSMDAEHYLQRSIDGIPMMLEEACNGPDKPNDDGDEKVENHGDLRYCSWEKKMKEFILQYP
ncbi:hypothetical protein BDZ89DRAFT_1020411 [Hymenopellis radicata]|nr:hypothetical protein BDZ89DRAFT_1020411 [Hymenopellis radicata]